MTKLRPSEICRDCGTQARERLSRRDVERYAQYYRDGVTLPPLSVTHTGDKHILDNGYHRLEAWVIAFGDEPITCDIKPGTIDEAKERAALANITQDSAGVARTDGDKRQACLILLSTEKWRNKSTRDIADAVKCSQSTAQRAKDTANVSESPDSDSPIDVTRVVNGKRQSYKQKRRKKAAKAKLEPKQAVRPLSEVMAPLESFRFTKTVNGLASEIVQRFPVAFVRQLIAALGGLIESQ